MSPEPAWRRADRAVRSARRTGATVSSVVGKVGFPYRKPTVPRTVDVPPERRTTGADFDTEWARRPVARSPARRSSKARCAWPCEALASPEVTGLDRLVDLRGRRRPAGGHLRRQPHQPPRRSAHAHVDPRPVAAPARGGRGGRLLLRHPRHRRGVGPRARRLPHRAHPGQPAVGRAGLRRSSSDGWSLLIFPEGGRSPDGWGQPFRGGAGVPVGAPRVCPWCRCTSTGPAPSSARG